MSDATIPPKPKAESSDPWTCLRALTPARIGLARCGDSVATSALLDYQLAHARARDAIHRAVDFPALSDALSRSLSVPSLRVKSAASDRALYIRRPDLGRRLDPASRPLLEALSRDWDAVFVIGDGLSSAAIDDHAVPLLATLLPRLSAWRLAPVILAEQARVALGDEIGALLGARLAIMLIGERPGLSVGNSLGAYLTWDPRPGRQDSERNCVSNIHALGLGYAEAAEKIRWLMCEARLRRLSGVALKENVPDAALSPDIPPSLTDSGAPPSA